MSTNTNPESWVDEHSDYLYSYAITRIFNKEDVLDIIQETFLSALKAKNTFKGESTERTWLTAILKRKIIDYYRKKIARKTEPFNDLTSFEPSANQNGHWKKEKIPKEWGFENDDYEKAEFQSILKNCLSFLPQTWASVFTLRTIEELSTEEVCKELDITPSNLWTTIHRAKLQLRECIEKHWLEKRKNK